jgi:uncharacterized YigZ family protein
MQDEYQTIALPVTGYFMNSGSKFHAYVFPVQSETQANDLLLAIRKEHPKARHYCTAIRLLADGSFTRSSDDGEPAGSAGKPILNQLLRHNITYVYVVVVRYFGGTKLGIPGLIEAYKCSTEDALSKAAFITRTVFAKVRIVLPFEAYPGFLNFLMQRNIQVLESEFQEQVILIIALRLATVTDGMVELLRAFTQLDLPSVEVYAEKLGWQIDVLPAVFTR